MNKSLVRLGFILVLLAFLGGLLIPKMINPRLGVSAHLGGIMAGTLLILVGMLNDSFRLSPGLRKTLNGAWGFAAYANWGSSLVGGLTGAGRLTPLAGAGHTGSPLAETVMAALIGIVVVGVFLGSGLAIWGLRSGAQRTP